MARGYILSIEAQQDVADLRAFDLNDADAQVARYVLAEITAPFAFLQRTPAPDIAARTWQTSR